MADKILKFVRDVAKDEWSALPRDMKKDEEVVRFRGHTYGLDRDYLMYLGRETVPVNSAGVEGFFTCPVEFLIDLEGNPVRGDYVRLDRTK